jgi:hypothetical protein
MVLSLIAKARVTFLEELEGFSRNMVRGILLRFLKLKNLNQILKKIPGIVLKDVGIRV